MFVRQHSRFDRLLSELERALGTASGATPEAGRASPAAGLPEPDLDDTARRHAAGLMRINHAGEVCAQALYSGQALVARDAQTREQLLGAAAEETDHLAWCTHACARCQPSEPAQSAVVRRKFCVGAVAALVNDRVSLGFVVETERQVEAHLGEHLERLPTADAPSRAVVAQMQIDEARHGQAAKDAGGIELPMPIPTLMRAASLVMKAVAYRV